MVFVVDMPQGDIPAPGLPKASIQRSQSSERERDDLRERLSEVLQEATGLFREDQEDRDEEGKQDQHHPPWSGCRTKHCLQIGRAQSELQSQSNLVCRLL